MVAGTLSAGGAAAQRSLGEVSGTIAGGSSGSVLVKLSKLGRKRLAAKRRLRVRLSGAVTNGSGQSAALSGSLRLVAKR